MLAKDPVLGLGFPSDWVVFAGLDSEKIYQALAKDNQDKDGSEISEPFSIRGTVSQKH